LEAASTNMDFWNKINLIGLKNKAERDENYPLLNNRHCGQGSLMNDYINYANAKIHFI
jgi:hypothetical protein